MGDKIVDPAPEMTASEVGFFLLQLLIGAVAFTMFLFDVLFCFMVGWNVFMVLASGFTFGVMVAAWSAAAYLWREGVWRALLGK